MFRQLNDEQKRIEDDMAQLSERLKVLKDDRMAIIAAKLIMLRKPGDHNL